MNNWPAYYRYWGKAKPKEDRGPKYHLLPYHCLDVAAVGWVLFDPSHSLCRTLARHLRVNAEWLQAWFTFCLILHDLGKFFRAFQNQTPALSETLVPYDARCVYRKRHDTLGFALWQTELSRRLSDVLLTSVNKTIGQWLEIVCGHHGQPPEKGKDIRSVARSCLLPEDELAAEQFVREVIEHWMPDLTQLGEIEKDAFIKTSWRFAGVAVLADWLGSNQSFFTYIDRPLSLEEYWRGFAVPRAKEALSDSQLQPRAVNSFQAITQQFTFIQQPTPLQEFAATVPIKGSQHFFLLEDVTGAGKTEAAMVLVHRLMGAGLAGGVYVGLPTMATANAMYKRMAASYRSLFTQNERPSLVLSHGARQLSKEFTESVGLSEQPDDKSYVSDELSASAYCNHWLADNCKKALLADVGVGTIDQALLAVLPVRHQALRLFGLSNKVLLVDEVHAFDPYMRELLVALLQAHAAQGGSAILLSATVPYLFRSDLVSAFAAGAGVDLKDGLRDGKSYPLVTHLSGAEPEEIPVSTRDCVRRQVAVIRLSDAESAEKVVRQVVEGGGCVCWIRNTIVDAREAYERIAQAEWMQKERVVLFHSRFAMIDRQAIEEDVLTRFGKESDQATRTGQVLIATQVVEQSLDLDFDIMISDLAPIDLLIQRAGRLQRHRRDRKGDLLKDENVNDGRGRPVLYVLSPDAEQVSGASWLREMLPGTQAVYPNVGQLWLTIRALLKNNGFAMPENARELIESVYGEDRESIPEQLQIASQCAMGAERAQHSMGEFNCLDLEKGYSRNSAGHNGGWDEEMRTPTRLGQDSVRVALAQVDGDRLKPYANAISHAWPLSEMSISAGEWAKAKELVPENIKRQISELRENVFALKWVEILPLVGELNKHYQARSGWLGGVKKEPR